MTRRRVLRTVLRNLLNLFRDARRYRWLRSGNAYAPEEWGLTGGEKLDQWIDESIHDGTHPNGYVEER